MSRRRQLRNVASGPPLLPDTPPPLFAPASTPCAAAAEGILSSAAQRPRHRLSPPLVPKTAFAREAHRCEAMTTQRATEARTRRRLITTPSACAGDAVSGEGGAMLARPLNVTVMITALCSQRKPPAPWETGPAATGVQRVRDAGHK
jgi:hypothetical protein